MTARRPFESLATMHRVGTEIWTSLTEPDWLEAFAAHPKIGEQKTGAKWSATEQSGMDSAGEQTVAAMRRLNKEYEQKFGWIFIVCATGKSAGEMLRLLGERINNDPSTELRIAAAEQLTITNLRLEKLISE